MSISERRLTDLSHYTAICDFYERRVSTLNRDQAEIALATLQNHRQAMAHESQARWRTFRAHLERTITGVGELASAYLHVSRIVNRYDALIVVFEAISSAPPSSPSPECRSD